MTKIDSEATIHPLFHPVAHYDFPSDVLNDASLSPPEKRLIYRPGPPICTR